MSEELKACKHPGFFRGYCESCETFPIEDELRALVLQYQFQCDTEVRLRNENKTKLETAKEAFRQMRKEYSNGCKDAGSDSGDILERIMGIRDRALEAIK